MLVKKKRINKGNPPHDSLGIIATDGEWAVHLKPSYNGNEEWASMKVVALRSRRGKANYWMAWHKRQQRFAVNGDLAYATANDPALLTWLRTACELAYPL